jgi:uncharacterized protein (TIGR00251 family)
MIAISEHAEGCVLPVRAQPGARRVGIQGVHNGALKIAVTAPAEHGRANEAIVEVLCEALNVKHSQVELLNGHRSRMKRYLIRGVLAGDLEHQLLRFLH